MFKPSTISIDGPVAGGKNTVGMLLARKLGYLFLDTGAMYRALTWHAIQLGIELNDEKALGEMAGSAEVELLPSAANSSHCTVIVNGRDVSTEIRREEVEKGVSLVSRVSEVRQAMVARQRELAEKGKVVMAGRDIGTVVLPDAELKIYLTASPEERARRRYKELIELGKEASYEKVLTDLIKRDKIDSERVHAPLRPAADARIIDTDGLDVDQVISRIMELIEAD